MNIDLIPSLTPKFSSRNPLNNQAPLHSLKMFQLPLGSVRPGGWLRHQLDLMLEGMTGRLDEISPFLDTENGWFVDGNEGWEEQPYWLRGYYALAVHTQNPAALQKAQSWIEAVLNSQTEEGWFGSSYHRARKGSRDRIIADLWPHMVMCDALRLHYEFTRDERVISCMTRFFDYCRNIPDEEFIPRVCGSQWQEYREDFGDWKVGVQMKRAGEMLPHLYWLYNQTGEANLLKLAIRFYHSILPPVSEFLDIHVVNFVQRYGYPALYGQQAHPDRGVEESEYWYAQHMAVWGQQPRGAYGADEMIRSGKTDPSQGMETCAMIEFARKFYELGRITGQAKYADRCEDLLFNHFPAAQTPDLKGLHYLTASNLPQLDHGSGHDFWNEEQARSRKEAYPMLSYSPHRYRCCQHNVAMGWPFYAMNLWQASADGGLVAWMYGQSEVETDLPDCGRVRLSQSTSYPFSGKVEILIEEGNGNFPVYLRIPAWAHSLSLHVNEETQTLKRNGNDFLRITRSWKPGDKISLDFEMTCTQTRWPRTGSITVDRGPLSYSLLIEEAWKKCGGNEPWPEWEVFPSTEWNMGYVTDEQGKVQILKEESVNTLAGQPWTIENAPIKLTALVRKIPQWTLESGGSPQELRKSPILSTEPDEQMTLIPMGCARLRMSCLPEINQSPEARIWSNFKDC